MKTNMIFSCIFLFIHSVFGIVSGPEWNGFDAVAIAQVFALLAIAWAIEEKK
ncbi:MAG: hypothetical protein KIT08_01420 [Anaerolineales bacterium]|nr:MAG: hypothetical protein KIT08_01420 [Anaerolineales bacterium]